MIRIALALVLLVGCAAPAATEDEGSTTSNLSKPEGGGSGKVLTKQCRTTGASDGSYADIEVSYFVSSKYGPNGSITIANLEVTPHNAEHRANNTLSADAEPYESWAKPEGSFKSPALPDAKTSPVLYDAPSTLRCGSKLSFTMHFDRKTALDEASSCAISFIDECTLGADQDN